MLFMKKEYHHSPSPEMFSGTYGVWHMSSNPCEHNMFPNPFENMEPYPPHAWFFTMPRKKEMWHHRAHKPHWGCSGRRKWKHGLDPQEMNPQSFHEMFFRRREWRSKENCPNCTPAHHRNGGWRTSRNPLRSAALWFCWMMLRRLPEMWEILQIWRNEYLDWLTWRMVAERWECLEPWSYLNWLNWSGSLMVTSHTTLSSEIPPCLATLVFCRMLGARISPYNSCFYCYVS